MRPEAQAILDLAKAPLNGETLRGDEERLPRLAEVLDEIERLIHHYLKLPAEGLAMLIACWIAGTYLYERFSYYAYLALRSATPGCGKTRLLRVIAMFANGNPPITAIPTAAALFRSTRIVLILDEVDRLRNADRETFGDVIAVLNAGFEKGAVVERVEKAKGGFEVKSYPVYGPKALAGIENLADTLADRTFMIQMQRTPQRVPRLNVRRQEETAQQIRAKLHTWATQNGTDVEAVYEKLPDEVAELSTFDDRFQDIAEPLVVLATVADAERPEGPSILLRLVKGLNAAAGRREPSSRERELFAFLQIAETRLNGEKEVFIPSADLLGLCQEGEVLSRIESARALAGFLKHFDLTPGTDTAKVKRGYWIKNEWVREWQARYKGFSS